MDSPDKLALRDRSRARHQSLFVRRSLAGVLDPLSNRQDALNYLAMPGIDNQMAISDDVWRIKEDQRDQANILEQDTVRQERQIIDGKATLERAKLALRKGTDEVELAALRYAQLVKSLLMDAREYASEVELVLLDVERQKASLSVTREALNLKKVNAAIFLEYINKKMVEVDIAKYRLEAAKANVRAILADIEAGEAEIKLLNAQIEAIMMEAEKAGLQADVATIFAQIMVKQLSQVKLDVQTAEIESGFRYIASKLEDMLAIYDVKLVVEQLKEDLELALTAELTQYFVAEKEHENLKLEEQNDQRDIFEFVKSATNQNIAAETALKNMLVQARKAVASQRLTSSTATDLKRTWAQQLINTAQKWVYLHHQRWSTNVTREYEYITGD